MSGYLITVVVVFFQGERGTFYLRIKQGIVLKVAIEIFFFKKKMFIWGSSKLFVFLLLKALVYSPEGFGLPR